MFSLSFHFVLLDETHLHCNLEQHIHTLTWRSLLKWSKQLKDDKKANMPTMEWHYQHLRYLEKVREQLSLVLTSNFTKCRFNQCEVYLLIKFCAFYCPNIWVERQVNWYCNIFHMRLNQTLQQQTTTLECCFIKISPAFTSHLSSPISSSRHCTIIFNYTILNLDSLGGKIHKKDSYSLAS